jgi:hypothetical protein
MKNKTIILIKVGIGLGMLLFLIKTVGAWGSNSLDGWILGDSLPFVPEVGSKEYREPPTGYGGSSIYVPVGTKMFYYPASETGGEGSITYWIFDPGKCLDKLDPGYGINGPGWGLINSNNNFLKIMIHRGSSLAGCQGYEVLGGTSPYSPAWFFNGVRGSFGQAFVPGWYKWKMDGRNNEALFTLYNVYTKGTFGGSVYGGEDNNPDWHWGDVTATIDGNACRGLFRGLFGNGWKGFCINGDGASLGPGIEDISVFIESGTGIFSGAGNGVSVSREYKNKTWSDIKKLFR